MFAKVNPNFLKVTGNLILSIVASFCLANLQAVPSDWVPALAFVPVILTAGTITLIENNAPKKYLNWTMIFVLVSTINIIATFGNDMSFSLATSAFVLIPINIILLGIIRRKSRSSELLSFFQWIRKLTYESNCLHITTIFFASLLLVLNYSWLPNMPWAGRLMLSAMASGFIIILFLWLSGKAPEQIQPKNETLYKWILIDFGFVAAISIFPPFKLIPVQENWWPSLALIYAVSMFLYRIFTPGWGSRNIHWISKWVGVFLKYSTTLCIVFVPMLTGYFIWLEEVDPTFSWILSIFLLFSLIALQYLILFIITKSLMWFIDGFDDGFDVTAIGVIISLAIIIGTILWAAIPGRLDIPAVSWDQTRSIALWIIAFEFSFVIEAMLALALIIILFAIMIVAQIVEDLPPITRQSVLQLVKRNWINLIPLTLGCIIYSQSVVPSWGWFFKFLWWILMITIQFGMKRLIEFGYTDFWKLLELDRHRTIVGLALGISPIVAALWAGLVQEDPNITIKIFRWANSWNVTLFFVFWEIVLVIIAVGFLIWAIKLAIQDMANI